VLDLRIPGAMLAVPRGRGAAGGVTATAKRSSLTAPVPDTRAWLNELHAAGVLTEKQRDVLLWRAQGFSYQEIAYGLKVSISTVRQCGKRGEQKIAIYHEAQTFK
jgi:DNA-binding CsgD family transcriptional regulator